MLQLPNGNLLLIDDGTSRPGCYSDAEAGCFSRVVMYSLDDACGAAADDDAASAAAEAAAGCNRTAHVAWQIEFPLAVGRSPWTEVRPAAGGGSARPPRSTRVPRARARADVKRIAPSSSSFSLLLSSRL